ncbi:hypothetical protein [Mesobacterium pallidum]|uniref:capsular polysaccharide export protein, LipB/KpsS family n=1 Tax=Mesobacterium pallidum TaxID=2872037 RepID=UPI001EE18D4F|nr:hypothetical protein [Mesobacterium pallidum]
MSIPTYVMLRTSRFQSLQASLAGHLRVVDARMSRARRHVIARDGRLAYLKLMLRRPPEHCYDMARANVARKMARMGRAFAEGGWLHNVYLWRKAHHARLAEELIRDTWEATENPVAIVYNGTNVPDSVLEHVAPEGRCLWIENGYFRGTMQIDNRGINALNSLPRDAEFYRRFQPDGEIAPPELNVRDAKHDIHDAVALPEGTVFVPFQVDSDMQITRLSPWVSSMAHFHDILLEMVERLPEQVFVVKEHPMTRNALWDKVRQHPRILFQNGRPTGELIREAAGVLTINSTVGIESLALGKPTVLLGQACYVVPGLVKTAGNADELAEVLSGLSGWTPDPELRDHFLYYLRHEFLFGDVGQPIDDTLPERLAALLTRRHEDKLP